MLSNSTNKNTPDLHSSCKIRISSVHVDRKVYVRNQVTGSKFPSHFSHLLSVMTSKLSTSYVFVINNPKQQLPLLDGDFHPYRECLRYCIWQLEMGAKGTPHYQGYIEFFYSRTIIDIHANFDFLQRAALFPRKGTQTQAILYSSKLETQQEGPWEFGTPSAQVLIPQ